MQNTPVLAATFHKLKSKFSPTPRESASIIHQPRKCRKYVKIRKMGQKVNGISVSETPKIGERPYPSPFHPVEITPKISQFQGKSQGNHNYHSQLPRQHNTTRHFYHKNPIHQSTPISLDRGTDAISCLHYPISPLFIRTMEKQRKIVMRCIRDSPR